MLVSSGKAKSLSDVIIKFLDFAQTSSYDTQPWILVDDRLTSFYGATLQIPVRKKISGLITGSIDISTISSLGFYYTTSGAVVGTDFMSPLEVGNSGYFAPTLENIAYINSHSLSKVEKYLDEMPNVLASLLSSGVCVIQLYEGYTPSSPELFSFGADDDRIYETWKELLDTNKKINSDNNLVVILSGGKKLYDYLGMTNDEYISSFSNRKYSELDKKIFNLIHDYGYCIIDCSSAILDKYKTLDDFMALTTTTSEGIYFNSMFRDFINSEVNRINNAYNDDLREKCQYFYASFQHTNVDKSTYNIWLRTNVSDSSLLEGRFTANHASNVDTIDVGYFRGSNTYDHTGTSDGKRYRYQNSTKYANNTINNENLFKNTGEFVAVGLHTHFDYNLWMCEQGGVTCGKEASHVDYNASSNNMLGLMTIGRYIVNKISGKGDTNVNAPLFPGTGCPWFCLTSDDLVDYSVDVNGIDYWFTRDDYNATITIRLHNYGYLPDVYQTISLGLLDNITAYSYKFPLYVCGGSQGISHDIWVRTRYNQTKPTYTVGNVYDLSIRNASGGGNNALYPTKFNGSSVSNFRVMSPEGIWEDIFGIQQSASVVRYYSCGIINNWGYPLQSIAAISDIQHNSAVPFSSYPYDNVIDTYAVNQSLSEFKSSSAYGRFIINLSNLGSTHDNGCQGIIANMGYSFSRKLPSGEVTIGGKKFLCIPNGWDYKLKFYRWHVGSIYNNEWNTDQLRDAFDNLVNPVRNNMYNGKILIPLEGL